MIRVVKEDVNDLWAHGIADKDKEKIAEAKAIIKSWNEKNPETKIKANMKSIIKKAGNMRKSSAERLLKATPKEMKGYARERLGE